MEQDATQAAEGTLADLVEQAGITVTDEGRERARAKLRAAAQAMPPAAFTELRRRFGRPEPA
jgi:hypothetical protein